MKKITFNRRIFIKFILIFFFNKITFSKNINPLTNKLTIIFGSCSNQNKDMKHWKEIITYKPNYIFLLGDNVYGDFFEKNAKNLKKAYFFGLPIPHQAMLTHTFCPCRLRVSYSLLHHTLSHLRSHC